MGAHGRFAKDWLGPRTRMTARRSGTRLGTLIISHRHGTWKAWLSAEARHQVAASRKTQGDVQWQW